MKVRETRAFVDEIDGGVARLLVGEEPFTIPRALLPGEAREGAWVVITIAVAAAPPDDTERKRKRLAKDDPGGDIKL